MSKNKKPQNSLQTPAKRNTVPWNEYYYGTSNEYVIHHPFVKRAREKHERYTGIVSMLWVCFMIVSTIVVPKTDLMPLIARFNAMGYAIYVFVFYCRILLGR